jgi:hypothetical protein
MTTYYVTVVRGGNLSVETVDADAYDVGDQDVTFTTARSNAVGAGDLIHSIPRGEVRGIKDTLADNDQVMITSRDSERFGERGMLVQLGPPHLVEIDGVQLLFDHGTFGALSFEQRFVRPDQ